MKIRAKTLALLVLAALVVIQFVPVERTNPEVTDPISAPSNVMAILERSCYDCHSNETRWPFYSYVAPVSWLVASDVEEGRDGLNFSEWEGYSSVRRADLVEEIYEHVAEGEMPLEKYLFLHPDAKLSPEDIETLRIWSGVEPEAERAKGHHEEGEEH